MIDPHDFVNVYNFCFDDGRVYTPSEREKAMLEDAINGYVAECEQREAELDASPAAIPTPEIADVVEWLRKAASLKTFEDGTPMHASMMLTKAADALSSAATPTLGIPGLDQNQIVKLHVDSALNWHEVFDDGRGQNNLTKAETSEMLCRRLLAALEAISRDCSVSRPTQLPQK